MIWNLITDIKDMIPNHSRLFYKDCIFLKNEMNLDKNINDVTRNAIINIVTSIIALYQEIEQETIKLDETKSIILYKENFDKYLSKMENYRMILKQSCTKNSQTKTFIGILCSKLFDDLRDQKNTLYSAIDQSIYYINESLCISTYSYYYKKMFSMKLKDLLESCQKQFTEIHFASFNSKQKFILMMREQGYNIVDNSDQLDIESIPNI